MPPNSRWEMRAGRTPSLGVTLRTPGKDEELVAGFLSHWWEVIFRREDLVSMRLPEEWRPGTKSSPRNAGPEVYASHGGSAARSFPPGSACGVCGKASIVQLRRRGLRRPESDTEFDPEMLCRLPEKLRAAQAVFGRTGGLHAAALFNSAGDLLVVREDIGRHNAVDKVIGWAFLENRLPLSGHILLVSGRGGFEDRKFSLPLAFRFLHPVSAPSSLAVQLAREPWFDARRFFARPPIRSLFGRKFASPSHSKIR